jgi:hypothetical protein
MVSVTHMSSEPVVGTPAEIGVPNEPVVPTAPTSLTTDARPSRRRHIGQPLGSLGKRLGCVALSEGGDVGWQAAHGRKREQRNRNEIGNKADVREEHETPMTHTADVSARKNASHPAKPVRDAMRYAASRLRTLVLILCAMVTSCSESSSEARLDAQVKDAPTAETLTDVSATLDQGAPDALDAGPHDALVSVQTDVSVPDAPVRDAADVATVINDITSDALPPGCTSSTPGNCCGVACEFAHAMAMCATGTCMLGICSAGFGNCDGNATNGCETNLTDSDMNCGACGAPCATGRNCVASACISCDRDGDRHRALGACGGDDCDDNSQTIYPGAPEVCDGIDNNCDGVADRTTRVSFPYDPAAGAWCASRFPLGGSSYASAPPRCELPGGTGTCRSSWTVPTCIACRFEGGRAVCDTYAAGMLMMSACRL